MATVAVMLNLRADALTAAYRGNNQRLVAKQPTACHQLVLQLSN